MVFAQPIHILWALLSLVIPCHSVVTAKVSSAASIEISAEETATVSKSDAAAYTEFCAKHGRSWKPGTSEYNKRLALFAQRRKEVMEHNGKPDMPWTIEVNKFSDTTSHEFKAMMGYKRTSDSLRESALMRSASFVQGKQVNINNKTRGHIRISDDVTKDWTTDLYSAGDHKFFRNQGGCGSCWAVAAAGAIEMHRELWMKKKGEMFVKANLPKVSYAQIMDCTSNPDSCGGDGGCQGATAELAFKYAAEHGLVQESVETDRDSDRTCNQGHAPMFHLAGHTRLATNDAEELLKAIANDGPVVVSVAASDWQLYSQGVFGGCLLQGSGTEVDHAVVLVAVGSDATHGKYWKIRNSWGHDWGEAGYMRIKRHNIAQRHCGQDKKPLEGVGCKRGANRSPDEIEVCGMCGILSDSSYPTFED